ncbi:DUF5707 domain-containing protein [Streptomyces sp. NPDC003832]
MRIRATVAAVTGALALSALAVPFAQADSQGAAGADKPSAAERFGSSPAKSAFSTAAAAALPTVSNVTVNAGKSIVLGTTTVKTFNVSLTASHESGIADAYIDLWHGTDPMEDIDGLFLPNEEVATCTAASATTSTCKLTITADAYNDLFLNSVAGNWHVTAGVLANDGEIYWDDFHSTHKVQRESKLTVNASPEPVKKNTTLTVTGKLTRANWESSTGAYAGLPSGQSVVLQFRKAGSTTYTNVKGIKTASGGALKTTVTATTDGYWRFTYAGITSTAGSTAAGDYVDVR